MHDGTQFHGCVDHGIGNDDSDSLLVTSEALVLMVVPITTLWKIPI